MTSSSDALRIGTRESKLARLQTDMIAAQLHKRHPDLPLDVVPLSTSGDKILNKPIAQLGSLGVFVKELEEALLERRVDLVVHSFKDVPTAVPDGLMIGAALLRDDPRDVFLSRSGLPFAELPAGSRIATSSRRRAAQLGALRDDIEFVDVRGNVPTRLRKLDEGESDAMVLAAAGLLRLGYQDRITQYLDPSICVPAAGQAALAVQCRDDDQRVRTLLAEIDDPIVRAETDAERAFLERVGGGCSVPIGVLARLDGDVLTLTACISDGKRLMRKELSGRQDEAQRVGTTLADTMLSAGGEEILSEVVQRPQQPISPP